MNIKKIYMYMHVYIYIFFIIKMILREVMIRWYCIKIKVYNTHIYICIHMSWTWYKIMKDTQSKWIESIESRHQHKQNQRKHKMEHHEAWKGTSRFRWDFGALTIRAPSQNLIHQGWKVKWWFGTWNLSSSRPLGRQTGELHSVFQEHKPQGD